MKISMLDFKKADLLPPWKFEYNASIQKKINTMWQGEKLTTAVRMIVQAQVLQISVS